MKKFLIILSCLFLCVGVDAQYSKTDSIADFANNLIGKKFQKKGVGPNKFNNVEFIKFVYNHVGIDVTPILGNKDFVVSDSVRVGDIIYLNYSNSYGIVVKGSDKVATALIITAEKPSVNKRILTTKEINDSCLVYRPIPVPVIVEEPKYVAEPIIEEDTTAVVAEPQLPDTLTIAMVGDIMLGTTYPEVELPANDGKNLFDDVRDILINANLTVGNFEGVMCEGGTCTKRVAAGRSYAFRMPTSYAHLLGEAGFDFLSLANNHSNDFGPDGIRSTARCLDEQNIKYAGAKALECKTAIVERDGIKYGLCAFGHNSHTYQHIEFESAKAIVKSLRDSCDILIVSFHGGAEGAKQAHLPKGKEIFLGEDRGTLRQFAHTCIDLGADVVYGHGPHVTRAIEAYKGRFVVYSLGNFCTPYGINLAGISGYAPVVTIRIRRDGSLIDGKINSFIQQKGIGPRRDTLNKVAQEMKSLTIADFETQSLSIDNDGTFVIK